MKYILFIFSLLFIFQIECYAGVGDTTTVRSHNEEHWNWYGTKDNWVVFPSDSLTYRKIQLRYKLGCPSTGCSGWDYTTKIEVLHRNGETDSTLKQAPSFTVNSVNKDSVLFTLDTTYCRFFNATTKLTDSSICTQSKIMIYGDTNNPLIPTDSLWVWETNFYNYTYDTLGKVIDSTFITSDSTWYLTYTPYYDYFPKTIAIELARVMTPYSGNKNNGWYWTWYFDVTDYEPLLHDSVQIRAFYGGWQDGFTITLDFDFIEGTPPRDVIDVQNVYSSGMGGFQYGNTSNPINNILKYKKLNITIPPSQAMFRVVPSGHSFGGAQNCAEFCPKNYYVKVNGAQTHSQLVFRYDCGMNAVYPQTGTWLYDRSAWCPGDRTLAFDHDLTPYLSTGLDSIKLDFDPYTYSGGASFHPNYIIEAQLFTYNSPNFMNDAGVEEIITPNNDERYNRYNPICGQPIIVIKNYGSDTLKSLNITYGVSGNTLSNYSWTGSLKFLEIDTVYLPGLGIVSGPSQNTKFEVKLSQPNGVADQNVWNDEMHSFFDLPPVYMNNLIVFYRPNLAYWENKVTITNSSGIVVYSKDWGTLAANTFYRDTLQLPDDCYELRLTDSDKDGLSFFANNDGSGFLRLSKVTGGDFKVFSSDFGTQIIHQFNIGNSLSVNSIFKKSKVYLYPNPSSGKVNIDVSLENDDNIEIYLYDLTGKLLKKYETKSNRNQIHSLDISSFNDGLYFIKVIAENKEHFFKVIKK